MTRRLFAAGLLGIGRLSAAVQSAASPWSRPKLKITAVRTALIRAHGNQLHIRIETDQGITGQGETTNAEGAIRIVPGFRAALVGQDPLSVDTLWERLRTSGIFAGAQAGNFVCALAGVETALWDLAGKALGLPVWQLLGGKMRDRIRLYCDSQTDRRDDPEAAAKIAQMKSMGFTAVKIDIDDPADPARFDKVNFTATNAEIEHMVDKVAFMRESLDKRTDLAVDMHCRYDLGTAKRVVKELEPFRLMWVEEPVAAENIDAMREVRASTHTPICCGENLYLRHGFRDLLEKRCVDIIEPDFQKCGGLLEGRRIADLAHTHYIPVAPHCVASPIGLMASCHVAAALPNFLVLEWHWILRLPLWRDFLKQGDIIERGYVPVPDRPGLGVEMNDEAVRKVQVPGTEWFA